MARLGLAVVLLALVSSTSEAPVPPDPKDSQLLFDFTADARPWVSIDDVVMGGQSSSEMVVEEGRAVFRGDLILEGGGFASVRSEPERWDLPDADGLALRVRGDGKTYAFRLRMTGRFDGVSYQVKFRAPEEWQTVRFRFDEFEPVFRGRRVRGAPALDPGEIRTFGFLISDGQEGPFRLEVERVEAVQEEGPDAG